MTVPTLETAFLTLNQLSNDEKVMYSRLRQQLAKVLPVNRRNELYYEGSMVVRQLDIAVPPQLRDLEVVAGWAGTALDVLEERLRWDGYTSTGDLMGLDDVVRENGLLVTQGGVQLDALIAGTSFITTGRGDTTAGEPEILNTPESPKDCTAMWDTRGRRIIAALSRTVDASGFVTLETLYLLNETITLERQSQRMVVVARDKHNLDRVPVARLVNRARSSRVWGRSEVTPAVRYYVDAAVRTMLSMEIGREFYTAPKRYALGADEEAFLKPDGTKATGWEAYMGQVWAIGRDENGDIPTVGQFPAASPQPYIDQIRAYALLLAAEIGIPTSYLGYTTENPASADAIHAGTARLIMRSLSRQQGFTPGWLDNAYNILLWRDGKVDPVEFAKLHVNWRDPSTDTPAAAADATTKLIAAGVLTPDSAVTYDRLGMTQQEQEQLTQDKRRANARATLNVLATAATGAGSDGAQITGNSPVTGELNRSLDKSG